MKTIIEMAREAGFVSAQFWPDDFKGLHASVERFATLVKAARDAELLEGVEMPEAVLWAAKESEWMWRNSDDHGHPYHIITKGQKVRSHQIPLVTADQLRETVAAAVAKKERDMLESANRNGHLAAAIEIVDALKAENERLRGALNAICSRLPQPDEFAYPNYFAKVELENARAALKGQP